MKYFFILVGVIMFFGGIYLAGWLGIYKMLYGGITQAVNCWGINNSDVVWGIIKAVFFEFGIFAGIIICMMGIALIQVILEDY